MYGCRADVLECGSVDHRLLLVAAADRSIQTPISVVSVNIADD